MAAILKLQPSQMSEMDLLCLQTWIKTFYHIERSLIKILIIFKFNHRISAILKQMAAIFNWYPLKTTINVFYRHYHINIDTLTT